MKKFKVKFIDVIEAESEEEAYDNVRDFCAEIYNSGDVTAFEFEEVVEDGNGHEIKLPVKKFQLCGKHEDPKDYVPFPDEVD